MQFTERPKYCITRFNIDPLLRLIEVEWETSPIVVVSELESANEKVLIEIEPLTCIGKFKQDFGVVRGTLLIGFEYSPECGIEIENYKYNCHATHAHMISLQFFGYSVFIEQAKYGNMFYNEIVDPIFREVSRVLSNVFVLQIKNVVRECNFATIIGNNIAYGIKNHIQTLQQTKLNRLLNIIMKKFTAEMKKKKSFSVDSFFLTFRRNPNQETANPEYAWVLMHGRKRYIGNIVDESLLPPQETYLGEDLGAINFRVGSLDKLGSIRLKPNRTQYGYFNKYTNEYHIQLILEIEKLKQIFEDVTINYKDICCTGRMEQTIRNEIHLWFCFKKEEKMEVDEKKETEEKKKTGEKKKTEEKKEECVPKREPTTRTIWTLDKKECKIGIIKSGPHKFITTGDIYKKKLSFLEYLIPRWGLAHTRGMECAALENIVERALNFAYPEMKTELEDELNYGSVERIVQPEETPGPSS